jgi:hypothetical protein
VTFPTVTLTRTGGFAGVNDQYTVAPDGTLSIQGRGKPAARKKLTPAQLAELRALVTSPQLTAEAARGPIKAPGCADGFNYSVTVGSTRLSGVDCGGMAEQAPTLWKVIRLVQTAAQTG